MMTKSKGNSKIRMLSIRSTLRLTKSPPVDMLTFMLQCIRLHPNTILVTTDTTILPIRRINIMITLIIINHELVTGASRDTSTHPRQDMATTNTRYNWHTNHHRTISGRFLPVCCGLPYWKALQSMV